MLPYLDGNYAIGLTHRHYSAAKVVSAGCSLLKCGSSQVTIKIINNFLYYFKRIYKQHIFILLILIKLQSLINV